MALLAARDLAMYYATAHGPVRAVDGVSFRLEKGEALGIAGESGCGKTSVALTLLRLLPGNARVVGGTLEFDGEDVLGMEEEQFRQKLRWKRLAMIFQGALNALNPVHRIGEQIAEAIRIHENVSRRQAAARARDLLAMVGIHPSRYGQYPHELSGGMKQRAVIAMALACNPDLIVADEPTTALDVMVQAQVLQAIEELRRRFRLSLILISHDLSVIAQTCDKVAVMYAGKIVEYGDTAAVFRRPLHPYTQGLLAAFPDLFSPHRAPIRSIPGDPPHLASPPPGCRFHPRCPLADEGCRLAEPALEAKGAEARTVACFKV